MLNDGVSELPDWIRKNVVVKSWLYNTVTHDLAEFVITHGSNSRGAWVAIEEHFLGNQETRALHSTPSFTSSLRMIFRSTTTASSSRRWPPISPILARSSPTAPSS